MYYTRIAQYLAKISQYLLLILEIVKLVFPENQICEYNPTFDGVVNGHCRTNLFEHFHCIYSYSTKSNQSCRYKII